MPAYDSTDFRPPAPVALVSVRSVATGRVISNVSMLLDSGADIFFLQRKRVAELVDLSQDRPQYEVEAFDGTKSHAPVVRLKVEFLGKSFTGQFLLIDAPHGFLGRNILNNVSIAFDGPSLSWSEIR